MSNGYTAVFNLRQLMGGSCAAIAISLSTAASAGIGGIEAANNQIAAQIQLGSMNYTETARDPDTRSTRTLDTEDGHLAGYGLSWAMMKNLWLGRDYFEMQYRTLSGLTDYKGATQGNAYGSRVDKSGAKVRDVRFRYGAGGAIDEATMATLYAELGRHSYVRELGLGERFGYQETYSHGYYGIGALLQYSPTRKLVYSFNLLVGRTHGGKVVVALPAPYAGFSATLGDSSLHTIGVSVDYALARNIRVNAGVDVTGWSYGASSSYRVADDVCAYMPDSTTDIKTARVGVGFSL